MQAFSMWHWLLMRYRRLRAAAAKAPAQGLGGGWIFLLAFCSCLGFLLVMLSPSGVTVATLFPDAAAAKAIASLFSVSVRVKDTPAD